MTVFVFAGDSITDAHRDRDDITSLGDGYVSLLADELDGHVINVGISGNRAVDLRGRWGADVLAHSPEVLTVYVGVNDTWRRYDRDDETTAAVFEEHLRAVLDTVPAGTRVILMEPFLLPVDEAQHGWLGDLDGKRAVVTRLADEYGTGFVPLHRVLTDAAGDQPASLAADGVHPTPAGARVIADAWRATYDGAAL